ncbi:MAG: hypothetical protein AAGI49_06855 [Bacteroidota bacterium]
MEELIENWRFLINTENRLQEITDNVANENLTERKRQLSECYTALCIEYNNLFDIFNGRKLQEQELSRIAGLAAREQHSAIRGFDNSIGKPTRVRAISNMLGAYHALIIEYTSATQNNETKQSHTDKKPSKWKSIVPWILSAILAATLLLSVIYFILREAGLKKDHDKEIADFKLWTAYQVQDSAQYKEQFDTLINPLKVFAENFDRNRLNDNLENANIDITSIDELDTLSIYEDHPWVKKYQDSILYDFNGGFVSYSPDSLQTDSIRMDSILELANVMFRPSEKFLLDALEKNFEKTEIPSLEEGLEKILNTETEGTIFSPILFYGLYTKTFNDTIKRDGIDTVLLRFDSTALMYRFPKYVHSDASKRLSLLENYYHLPRKYYEEFMNGKAYQLSEDIFLSSVYFDYKRKTPTPIRTLMMKLSSTGSKGEFYLFCIDFKFKD